MEEKIAAVEGYVSYSGRFEIRGDKVVHHIEVSLFPNWIGVTQERLYEFKGDRLTLSTPLMLVGGRQLSTHVIWERASRSPPLLDSTLAHSTFTKNLSTPMAKAYTARER